MSSAVSTSQSSETTSSAPESSIRPGGRLAGSNWWVGAALVLLAAHALDMGLLAYAMYVLIGALLLSRWLTNVWSESLSATRQCNRLEAELDDIVAIVIQVENGSALPIPWVLIEDLLPRQAISPRTPALQVQQQFPAS